MVGRGIMVVVAAAWMALAAGPAAAVNKCVGQDGRVVYSDKPCAAGEKQSDVKVLSTATARATAPSQVDIKREVLQEQATDEQVNACLNEWRPTMRDPRGLYYTGAVLRLSTNRNRPEQKPWKEVVLDAYARNGFGGYNATRLVCSLAANGSIDPEGMKDLKAIQWATGHLD